MHQKGIKWEGKKGRTIYGGQVFRKSIKRQLIMGIMDTEESPERQQGWRDMMENYKGWIYKRETKEKYYGITCI